MINRDSTGINLVRTGGAFTAVFSLVIGVFVLFATSGACTFVSGLLLVFLGILLIIGILGFLLGNALSRRKKE